MKKIILIIIFISIFTSGCTQNYQNSIDKSELDCLSNTTSTQSMNQCIIKSISDWNKKIDTTLLLIKQVSSKSDFEKIQLAQKQWEIYRDSEFATYDLIRQKEGTMFQNVATNFEKELVKSRALELEQLYKTLKY